MYYKNITCCFIHIEVVLIKDSVVIFNRLWYSKMYPRQLLPTNCFAGWQGKNKFKKQVYSVIHTYKTTCFRWSFHRNSLSCAIALGSESVTVTARAEPLHLPPRNDRSECRGTWHQGWAWAPKPHLKLSDTQNKNLVEVVTESDRTASDHFE